MQVPEKIVLSGRVYDTILLKGSYEKRIIITLSSVVSGFRLTLTHSRLGLVASCSERK